MQETVQHFREVYDIQIPESTVRGLRSKYKETISSSNQASKDGVNSDKEVQTSMSANATKPKNSAHESKAHDLTELNYGNRGRPMRLGKVSIEKLNCAMHDPTTQFYFYSTLDV